ncbi:MAG: aminopeptidase P family protein [Candidatus Eisenbacteria bacterium]|uniref:Aminopeptidase P family protein n=1 Tax=Eiseniibacteriota bacterium TaxID=2212470 RepID=A0A9D6QLY0_UNCEI|nr:aminopeptidase P family protein [Candidatus Eisenbacteria bacterium]MBI3539153.1 aminopeptidase P family protein [Candidatus Eisenbacteria bacterium]
MNAPRRDARLDAAREALARERADWLLIPASADFLWLTGGHARVTERLVLFALPARGEPFALVPRLEAEALGGECPWLALEVWDEDEDPLARLAKRVGDARSLLLGEGFRTAPLLTLAARAQCRAAAPVIAPLRAVKDAEEIARMKTAARHADRVVTETAASLRPGLTERQVAGAILARFEAVGQTSPWAIVAAGANAAFPHHSSSDRAIAAGECVLLDLGAYHEGYGSDITRTFWLGRPPEDFARVYAIVNESRAAGITAARAGAKASAVDAAARAVIAAAGYGEYFIHRTGHGVGLEIHEPPYLVAGNDAPLLAGMTHSVEPGVYLPGRFGVRLEDLVVVEAGGARRLNEAPFEPALDAVGAPSAAG